MAENTLTPLDINNNELTPINMNKNVSNVMQPYQQGNSLVDVMTAKALNPASDIKITPSQVANNQVSSNQLDVNKAQTEIDVNKNSLIGQASPYLKGFNMATQGVASLASIYLGFQQLGLQKEQVAMAKEQWAETKEELAHIKKKRQAITNKYMGTTGVNYV